MTASRAIIVAVSDATGETAEQASKAALAQVGQHDDRAVRTFPNTRTQKALEKALVRARDLGGLVVYTLVDKELRGAIKDLAQVHGVIAIDLIGGLIRDLAGHLDASPLSVPGLSHELDEEYFRRVAAVEFSVNHDDGKNPQNLPKADIVIVGISRASKTPLSNYIAHRGYRVANVPIVLGVPLPAQLAEVDPARVFALTVDPVVLMKIRRARMESLRMRPDADYGDLRQIRREINHAKRMAAEYNGWTLVDMSRKAVEEAASAIIETYRSRFAPDGTRRAPAKQKAPRTKAASKKQAAPQKKAASTKQAASKKKAAKKPRGRKKAAATKKSTTRRVRKGR
ncbi:MAG: kinase/pyrophosphorylase [Planctomycetota bacterium]|nr:kinase/pyrophosphorylase [Planctomycetota bacterium]